MTVNIDPSEVRGGASPAPSFARARLRLPLRTMLIGGLGGAGLIAFTVGAFSFFSTLADPRARLPKPVQSAASMPDLKDGLPALVDSNGPAKATTFNLPRPTATEPVEASQPIVQKAAVADPAPEPAKEAVAAAPAAKPEAVASAAAFDPQAPALRTGPTPPQIQNAATVPATRTAAIVAPPVRTVATIAPARAETVKAKPVQAASIAPVASPSHEPEAQAEPTSTATVTSPPPAHRAVAAKPTVQKAAARKATAKTASAEPDDAPAATPAAASSDDSDIPGARQFRAGVKAITGIFGGDTKED